MTSIDTSSIFCLDICECDQTGSLSGECGTDRQCDCKPGVGGLQCDQCLPGYTAFSAEGCRLDMEMHSLMHLYCIARHCCYYQLCAIIKCVLFRPLPV